MENSVSTNSTKKEYLLNQENNRYTVYPIKDKEIWDAYKVMQAAFWTAEEIDLTNDWDHYQKLNENEQHFIKMVLAFFAASDTIVNINLAERFTREVEIREAIIAYQFQIMIENVHSEVYSLQIDNIIRDKPEKNKLLNAIENFPCVQKKSDWAIKWIKSDTSFAQRLIAFAIVEGIFFSGSFCAIFWIKKKNLMPGLCDSNELISRDEGMHTDFACLLYKKINNKLDFKTVRGMFEEAVDTETEFICKSLPCSLIGMNSNLMTQYIQFVADRLLTTLGYPKIWNIDNPFDFMESISMQGVTNFFESRPTQYQNSAVLNESKGNEFDLMDDNF
jgi:ribonucleotide reductase beta subunit family protein with ferritin-like domain